MIEKNFRCKACGFQFKLALTAQELEAGGIPCPGCGEAALEEIRESAGASFMSRGAECHGNCHCCPSQAKCREADIEQK